MREKWILFLLLFVSYLSAATYEEYTQITNSAAHFWKFDEGSGNTAYDSLGGHNGTLMQNPTWTTGMSGSALSFSGLDSSLAQYVSMPTISYNANEAWTFSMWQNTYKTWWNGFIGGSLGADGYWMWHGGGQLAAYLVSPTPHYSGMYLGTTLPLNEWFHFAVVSQPIDATKVNFLVYLNGKYVTSINNVVLQNSRFSFQEIGKGDYHRGFGGVIDEVGIWDRALSSQEIATLAALPSVPEASSLLFLFLGMGGILGMRLWK